MPTAATSSSLTLSSEGNGTGKLICRHFGICGLAGGVTSLSCRSLTDRRSSTHPSGGTAGTLRTVSI